MLKLGASRRSGARRKKIGVKLFLLFLIVVAASGLGFSLWYTSALKAVDFCEHSETCDPAEESVFVVEEGESVAQIATALKRYKLIQSDLALRIYLKFERPEATLKAGSYSLHDSMSVAQIVDELEKGGRRETFRITFLPGDTLSSARQRLIEAGYAAQDIDLAFEATYDHPLMKGRPIDASLEGYIFGDTYEFYIGADLQTILTRIFDEMYAFIKENQIEQKLSKQNLSLYDGIVLASVVQRESGSLVSDMPKVAQIFLNRYRIRMALGSDAVIAYRADQLNPGRDKTDMTYLYTIGCPWDSRHCPGLPPSAIATPSKAALNAVAAPDETFTGYIYFLTGDDGKMYYARTESEHNNNARTYCKVRCGYL